MLDHGSVDQATLSRALDDFVTTVSGDFDVTDILRELAVAAVAVLPVDGAGVVVPRNGNLLRLVHVSGRAHGPVADLERLQERLQDGPCRESHRDGRVVNIADLALEGAWPEYVRQAQESGLRAVCALPLRARGRGWGVLDLYRREPRRLDAQELAAARTLANLATSYLAVTADRDAARDAQEQLAHRAMHDPLTGLPVRWVFLEQLGHALKRLARTRRRLAVMFLDLDGLKYVNDTYGHDAGDRLLLTCVERVRAALRPTDVVARLGGDEFVVLLEDLDDLASAERVARRVIEKMAAPYRPGRESVQPSASVGLALTDDPEQAPAALVAHADVAMYQAKQAGRGRYEVFDAAVYAAERRQAATLDRLVTALRAPGHEGELELHSPPIIDLTAGAGRRRLHAVEALVRWRHPERGLLVAGDFLPEAERSGLMVELGSWVLAAACRQLAAWDAQLGARAPQRLFVNVSAAELLRPMLAEHVASCLAEHGLAADRLTLEITETGLLGDPGAAAAAVGELRALGCELAIDDFGTGHSSLSRLVQVPAATVKVDRSFALGLPHSPDAAAVVAAVLGLGRSLGRAVVVEGVEDEETLSALRGLGATLAQGFHLGRPAPADAVAAGLAAAG
jgi:diguanylate cyclase (GGDEF)-like protein